VVRMRLTAAEHPPQDIPPTSSTAVVVAVVVAMRSVFGGDREKERERGREEEEEVEFSVILALAVFEERKVDDLALFSATLMASSRCETLAIIFVANVPAGAPKLEGEAEAVAEAAEEDDDDDDDDDDECCCIFIATAVVDDEGALRWLEEEDEEDASVVAVARSVSDRGRAPPSRGVGKSCCCCEGSRRGRRARRRGGGIESEPRPDANDVDVEEQEDVEAE